MSVKDAEKVNNAFKQLNDSLYVYRITLDSTEKEFSAYTGKYLMLYGEYLRQGKQFKDSISAYKSVNAELNKQIKIHKKVELGAIIVSIVSMLSIFAFLR